MIGENSDLNFEYHTQIHEVKACWFESTDISQFRIVWDVVARPLGFGYRNVGEISKDNKVNPISSPRLGVVRALRPVIEAGDHWEYRSTGVQSETFFQTAQSKKLVRNVSAYTFKSNDNRTFIFDENMNMLEIHKAGEVVFENLPVIKIFEWPLIVGKSWTTNGVSRRKGQPDLNFDMDVKVEKHGVIETKIGQFEVFYITAQGRYGGAIAQEVWYSPKLRAPAKMVYYFREGSVTHEIIAHVNASKSNMRSTQSTDDKILAEKRTKKCQAMAKEEVAPMKKLSPELVQKILGLEEPPKLSADGSLDTTTAERELVAECLEKSS